MILLVSSFKYGIIILFDSISVMFFLAGCAHGCARGCAPVVLVVRVSVPWGGTLFHSCRAGGSIYMCKC